MACTGLVVVGGVANPVAVAASEHAEMNLGAEAKSPVLQTITGKVTVDGTPANAEVYAIAMPNGETFTTYTNGEMVPRYVVAAGKTNAAGKYRLIIDPSSIPNDFVAADGLVNLDLRFADAEGEATYSLSVGGESRGANTVATVSIDLGTGAVTDAALANSPTADGLGVSALTKNSAAASAAQNAATGHFVLPVTARSKKLDAALNSAGAGSAKLLTAPDSTANSLMVGVTPLSCGYHVVSTTYGLTEWVHHIQGTTKLKATETAGSGRSETMGVGISPTGGSGSFSVGGTSTVSSTSTTSWGPVTGSYDVGNTVSYVLLRDDCNANARFKWTPNSIQVFLNHNRTATRRNYAYCTTVPSAWSYTKKQTTASSFAFGVSYYGISLMARSGWTSTSGQKFGPATGTAKICYNNQSGLDSSSDIGANSA